MQQSFVTGLAASVWGSWQSSTRRRAPRSGGSWQLCQKGVCRRARKANKTGGRKRQPKLCRKLWVVAQRGQNGILVSRSADLGLSRQAEATQHEHRPATQALDTPIESSAAELSKAS